MCRNRQPSETGRLHAQGWQCCRRRSEMNYGHWVTSPGNSAPGVPSVGQLLDIQPPSWLGPSPSALRFPEVGGHPDRALGCQGWSLTPLPELGDPRIGGEEGKAFQPPSHSEIPCKPATCTRGTVETPARPCEPPGGSPSGGPHPPPRVRPQARPQLPELVCRAVRRWRGSSSQRGGSWLHLQGGNPGCLCANSWGPSSVQRVPRLAGCGRSGGKHRSGAGCVPSGSPVQGRDQG